MPNALATLALYATAPLGVLAFALLRPSVALCVVFLGGSLLLPERIAFAFQGLPELSKYDLLSLGATVGAVVFHAGSFRPARWMRGPEVIVLLMLPLAVLTAMTNAQPLAHAPGLRVYDSLNLAFFDLVYMGLPFLLGATFLRTVRELRVFLMAMAIAGVLNSAIVIFEAWYSPQLHNLVYGYVQHSWLQLRRFGGWRPMGFLPHGLAMSLFVAGTVVAAAAAARTRQLVFRVPARWVAAWLFGMLLLCRSMGAVVEALMFLPAALFSRRVTQLRVAALFAWIVLLYPTLRVVDVFPTNELVSASEAVSTERAESLAFRFENEDRLLAHALGRPWFGWGGFGRSKAVEDGGPRVVADGFWINRMSARGVAGFLVYALLLCWPVVRAWRAQRRIARSPDGYWVTAAAIIVAMHAIDTVPNALFVNYPLVLAGGLSSAVVQTRWGARPPSDAARAPEGSEGPAPRGPAAGASEGRPFSDLLGRSRTRGPGS